MYNNNNKNNKQTSVNTSNAQITVRKYVISKFKKEK